MTTRPRPRPDVETSRTDHRRDRRALRRRHSTWLWEAVETRLLLAGPTGLNAITVTANPGAVTRPISGSTPIPDAFTVQVNTPTGESVVTVDYAISPVNATAGVDYSLGYPATGQLTFGLDGPFTQSLPLTVLGGTQDGGPHEVVITLTNPSANASLFPPDNATSVAATETINDAAAPGTLQFSMADYPVSTLGGTVDVTVTRTGGTASGVSVNYATSGGSAVPGVDYTPTSGTLNFSYGVTSLTFPVTITPDFLLGGPKTIGLILSNPTTAGLIDSPPGEGATLGAQSTATITIAPVNALIVTNTNNSGFGSLRQAILSANGLPGPNTISFDIPGSSPHVIAPTSPLPALTDATIIDGRTEPGYAGTPVVTIDGSNAGAGVNGLVFYGGSSAIYGLAVDQFSASGIVLASSNNIVRANRIGTDATGTVSAGNAYDGIQINAGPAYLAAATGNQILNNVISGNGNVGVDLEGATAGKTTIAGNLIGTDATGLNALPNRNGGVFLDGAGQSVIGGPGPARNLISGNGGPGVVASGASASGNIIRDNLIGTNINGSAALGNTGDGVFLDNAPGNSIVNDLISGNGLTGIRTMGAGASNNLLLGNTIGTNAIGTQAIGNAYGGVFLNGSPGTVVGNGTAAGLNLISGNGGTGLQILGTTATGNRVLGNRIGTDRTGQAALGNRLDGVFINSAPGNVVGGTTPGSGNLISANGQVGLQVFTSASTGNLIEGNLIGTNASGVAALGNTYGLFLNQAPSNTVIGNVVSGNQSQNVVTTQTRGGGSAVLLSTAPLITGSSITGVVLGFSQALDAASAEDLTNYSVRPQAPGALGSRIPIASAVYDPGALTVTLTLSQPIPVAGTYRVTLKAGPVGGLKSNGNQFLDGDYNGLAGGTSITFIRNGKGYTSQTK